MCKFTALLALTLVSSNVSAQDWSQWRGPSRDGVVPAAVIPKQWPKSTKRSWQVEIGEGYSSPVIASGRVFLHGRRDPDEIVTAIDLASGKVLWQQKYTASIDTSKLFCGTAMSPMLDGGALIIQVGSDVHGGRVLALDPATGKEKWSWKVLGPGYASPVAATIDGVRQIITMTNGSIVGINATDGSSLWSIPFPDDWHENIVTPIWAGSSVIVSGTRQGTHAYSVARVGPPTRPEAATARSRRSSVEQERAEADKWQTKLLWKNTDVTMYTASPVLIDGVIYGLSTKRRGQLVAIRASDGWLKWSTPGRDGNHASILQANDHVLFLTDGGVLIVARRTAEGFTEERRYELGQSTTWAQPVMLADGMLLREATGVVKLLWLD